MITLYIVNDKDHHPLDAEASINAAANGVMVTFESRGGSTGGRPRRNTDYNHAIEAVLFRAANIGLTLEAAFIASAKFTDMPLASRKLEIEGGTPRLLTNERDLSELRLQVGRALGAFGSASTSTKGTYAKRVSLHLSGAALNGKSDLDLRKLLLGE